MVLCHDNLCKNRARLYMSNNENTSYLGPFTEFQKTTVCYVGPAICMEQLSNHLTDFHKI